MDPFDVADDFLIGPFVDEEGEIERKRKKLEKEMDPYNKSTDEQDPYNIPNDD
jgi:hypothetical protein